MGKRQLDLNATWKLCPIFMAFYPQNSEREKVQPSSKKAASFIAYTITNLTTFRRHLGKI